MIELYMIIAMTAGGLLFALGGWKWKWIRRYLLPVVLGVLCLLAGKEPWRCGVLWIGLTGAFHLGYGHDKPYLMKLLVGISFALPTLVMGFTIFQILVPLGFLLLFRLSNWKPLSGEFSWKICEFLTGAGIGVIVARLIS